MHLRHFDTCDCACVDYPQDTCPVKFGKQAIHPCERLFDRAVEGVIGCG